MKAWPRKPFHGLAVFVLGLAVIAGNGAAGYLYSAAEKQSLDAAAQNPLAAIADMKVRQLSAWRTERLADARTPLLADLHRNGKAVAAHMSLVAPLLISSSPEPMGAIVRRIDPERFLYPLIQTWPMPSRSAETLLVRREGDEVVFLNELRRQRTTPLKLRLPIARAGLPAFRAVLGYEGVLNGVDYRGIPVLAATRHIPETGWYMAAKMDTVAFNQFAEAIKHLGLYWLVLNQPPPGGGQ